MGVSAGTTTATTTIPSYEPLRRDSFRPPSLEAADNSLGLTSSLSPVDEQVNVTGHSPSPPSQYSTAYLVLLRLESVQV